MSKDITSYETVFMFIQNQLGAAARARPNMDFNKTQQHGARWFRNQ